MGYGCRPKAKPRGPAKLSNFTDLSLDEGRGAAPRALRAGVSVRAAVDEDRRRWDDYVSRNGGRGFCWFAWRQILARSYRVKPLFLVAEDAAGEVAGLAALYVGRDMRGRPQAFGVRHGFLADDADAAAALYDACLAACAAEGSRSLVATSGAVDSFPSDAPRQIRKTIALRLRENEASTWRALRRETRVGINRSRKHGTTVHWGAQHLRQFYDVYAQNMLAKNVAIHSLAYFQNILVLLGERADVVVVRYEDRVIAGMIVLWGKETLDLYIGAWLREYALQVPYQRMYWEAICEAQKRGMKWVDMGESEESSGTWKFKTNFGGEPRDVFYVRAKIGSRGQIKGDNRQIALEPSHGSSLLGRIARSALAAADHSPLWVRRRVAVWRRARSRIV